MIAYSCTVDSNSAITDSTEIQPRTLKVMQNDFLHPPDIPLVLRDNLILRSETRRGIVKANTNPKRPPPDFTYYSNVTNGIIAEPTTSVKYLSLDSILPSCPNQTSFGGQNSKIGHKTNTRAGLTRKQPTTVEERRMRSRLNQQRYRKQQTNILSTLEQAITKLHKEIQALQREYDRVQLGSQINKSVWTVASEYFRIFRYGFRELEGARVFDLDILRMSMTADVAHNTSIGVGTLIRIWKIITVLFPEIHVELNKLTEVTECSVIANITTTITLSEPSLYSVFLQPKTKYERTLCSWIVTKLQGQRVVMHGSVRFSWCSASNRVIGVHSQTDMMTPLMQILGDIEDFAMLFSNARITPGFDLVR